MLFVNERMTWEQIQMKYPDQWVGLVDVRYQNDDGISVESAIVKYPEGYIQLGMVGAL